VYLLKRTVLISVMLLGLLAFAVSAHAATMYLSNTWFSDNFESYTAGTHLDSTGTWTGTANANTGNWIVDDGGNKVVKMDALSADSSQLATGKSGLVPAGTTQQVLMFSMKKGSFSIPSDNHVYIKVPLLRPSNGSTPQNPGWYGNGTGLRGNNNWSPSVITPVGSANDGAWHQFALVLDTSGSTGIERWYVDGYYLGSYSGINLTLLMENMVLTDTNRGAEDDAYIDNVRIGTGLTLPEPSSFVALGMFGLSALGLIKRRRA
jgi:hypothetical protein